MKPARPPMVYPFVTRRQVLERLDRDAEFVRECIAILHRRYLDRAAVTPPAGWMSSHRKAGEELHTRLTGDDSSAVDVAIAAKLAKRYTKQLTMVLRDEQLPRKPGLAVAAAVFGVRRSGGETPDPWDDPRLDPYHEPSEQEAEAARASTASGVADRPVAVEERKPSTRVAPAAERSSGPARKGSREAALQASAPMPRKRGRPKGSGNRTPAARTQPTRQRRRS